jgi:hypothetical protein
MFFFEKESKTFAPALCFTQVSPASPCSEPNRQKFFASFFQKIRPSFCRVFHGDCRASFQTGDYRRRMIYAPALRGCGA